MNLLVAEMRRSLKEKGELTITSDMEDLSDSLFFDQVDLSQNPALREGSSHLDQTGLRLPQRFVAWYADLPLRIKEL